MDAVASAQGGSESNQRCETKHSSCGGEVWGTGQLLQQDLLYLRLQRRADGDFQGFCRHACPVCPCLGHGDLQLRLRHV